MGRQAAGRGATKLAGGQARPAPRRGSPASERRPAEAGSGAASGVEIARLSELDEERRTVLLEGGGRPREAALDDTVELGVIRGAIAHGERAIVAREGDRLVVFGVLRTRCTPGLEEGEEYVIRAKRVEVRGEHELRLSSGAARLFLHAYGHVETVAETITTHARGVHKIVGRLLRLN